MKPLLERSHNKNPDETDEYCGTLNLENSALTARHYDKTFYDHVEAHATKAADSIVPLVLHALEVTSVLDVGCGTGTWLKVYERHGIQDVFGIDGPYLNQDRLVIPKSRFVAADISQPFALNRQFDLVQCLEVAEHLPETASANLVSNLTRHGASILFSAATPGQGGEFHINEQPLEHWRGLFAQHDYVPFDFLRDSIVNASTIPFWYAQNTLLYVRRPNVKALPPSVASTRVPDAEPIRDLRSTGLRVRAWALRRLPTRLVTQLAAFRHRLTGPVRRSE